jgi:hypothetical protein
MWLKSPERARQSCFRLFLRASRQERMVEGTGIVLPRLVPLFILQPHVVRGVSLGEEK